ncbi:MAG: alanine racemase [Butyricicoccus porcorum]
MKKFVIERDKLAENSRRIQERAGVPVIAVLKADGYGFGMAQMAQVLAETGITMFAVTEPEDAVKLRELGFTQQEILVMRSTAMADEAYQAVQANAIATVGSPEAAYCLNEVAEGCGTQARAHVKIDTGMGRYGFLPDQYAEIKAVYTHCAGIQVTGIYTHFHSAFADEAATRAQYKQLCNITERLKADGVDCGMRHAANSSGLFCYDDLMLDAVRVGSAFTGRIPAKTPTGLNRLGYLESRVIELRTVPKGHTVGYGAGYVTKDATRIAVVPVGYTDGFSVEKKKDLYRFRDVIRYIIGEIKNGLGKGAIYITVNGQRARVLGHVGLCHVSVDVTGLDVHNGDTAILDVNPLYLSPLVPKEYV